MPGLNQESTEVEDDRRSVIEAALEASETASSEPTVPPVKQEKAPEQLELPLETAPTGEVKPTEAPAPTSQAVETNDRPPQSWKAGPKGKWTTLDPEVKQEVLRREIETTRVLNETAQARQFTTQFQQAVQPYMARLQSMNAHPITAVAELLKADHILTTAPKVQKAQYLAKLITDYGVDIEALDQVLAGKTQQADPVESRVEQLLQQRLAPFQQYLTQQEQAAQRQQAQATQELEHTVASMAADTVKFPYFERVRETMADIVEVFAKRGQTIGIEEAYNKAVAMDPGISQAQAQQMQREAEAAAAAKLNGRAQRALAASVSVSGAPSGSISPGTASNDRRATIAAALDASAGR